MIVRKIKPENLFAHFCAQGGDHGDRFCRDPPGVTGYAQLVRPLYRLLIFNVGPTPAELSARPLQRVDFYREMLEQIFQFDLKF